MAGSFRIPYKYDQDVADELLGICDRVVFDVSSVNRKSIDSRALAKSNIAGLARLLSGRDVRGVYDDAVKNSIEDLTYE